MPLGPRFTGSNPAEDDGFLRTIKSAARLTSEESEAVKEAYRHDRDTDIRPPFLAQFIPAVLLGVPAATTAENSGG
jgi:hypothetical protein